LFLLKMATLVHALRFHNWAVQADFDGKCRSQKSSSTTSCSCGSPWVPSSDSALYPARSVGCLPDASSTRPPPRCLMFPGLGQLHPLLPRM
jgi:hypothetical protein